MTYALLDLHIAYLDLQPGATPSRLGKTYVPPFSILYLFLMALLQAYSFDPLKGITSDQAHLVLGGQQLLWTEQSGPENLDPVAWPRAAASAEVFWTGKTLPDGTAANVQNALPRLHDVRYVLSIVTR